MTSIIEQLIAIRNRYNNEYPRLKNLYSWNDGDARLGVFAKCTNIIEPFFYSYVFSRSYLLAPDFHKQFGNLIGSRDQMNEIHRNYLMYIRINFSTSLHYAIESSFRIFVRTINNSVLNEGTDKFSRIFNYLLNQTNLDKHRNLLEFFTLIRNSMHNNGIYTQSKTTKHMKYHDEKYSFVYGEQIKMNTQLLVDITNDAFEMLKDIVTSRKFRNIREIRDPTFHHLSNS